MSVPLLGTQRQRRRDVLLLFVSYPLVTVALLALLGDSRWFGTVHLLWTIASLTFGIRRVGRVGKAIADDLDARLDERQIAVRNSAYLDAYRVIASLAVLGPIWMAIGQDIRSMWTPNTYEQWSAIVWGLFLFTTTLPSAILSWREPDARGDHELTEDYANA